MPVRRALGVRTFFNILGPLCNPAGVKRQLIGAFSFEMAKTMANISWNLDCERVLCVHAQDGLDEISTTSHTDYMITHESGHRNEGDIVPERYGFTRATLEDLQGGDAIHNAEILRSILAGKEQGAKRDIVLLNAAHALLVSGKFDSVEACFKAANESIDSGAALGKLQHLIEASNRV